MAKESVAQLFRAAQVDSALRQKLSAAPSIEAFVNMAKEYGYDFSLEEWQSMTKFSVEEVKGKLSEIPGI